MTTQFAYRTGKTIGITNAYPAYTSAPNFTQPEGNLRCCAYGPSGFSPNGTYIVTWERFMKLDSGEGSKNLRVWQVETGKETCAFTQKTQTGWNLQYTTDETLCARSVTNEVQFFDPANMSAGTVHRLRVEGVAQFAISPGKNQAVAVFIPEKKGGPASVRVYNIPSFNAPVSQKTFFKADRVQLKWNALGTSLLCMTSTDVDKSNKSYYGENNLYLLGVAGNYDCRVALDKEGPIHDVTWSPDSKEFGAIYGYMPAKITMFDGRANVTHSLPAAPRNTILFSPNSKYVIIAGFGNLQGTMDIYERQGMKKITTIDGTNTSHCEWCPDSRHILTATTSPRLRVDNGIKIWHYKGQLVYLEDHHELFYAVMRPQPVEDFLHVARVRVQNPMLQSQVLSLKRRQHQRDLTGPHMLVIDLRPLRQSTTFVTRMMDHLVVLRVFSSMYPELARQQRMCRARLEPFLAHPPGLNATAGQFTSIFNTAAEPLSKNALKNKKKREAAAKRKEAEGSGELPESQPVNGSTNGTSTPVTAAATPALTSSPTPTSGDFVKPVIEDRKIRNLTKKLRAIEELRLRQAGGEKLEATQTQKIAAYDATLKELEALGWSDT
ncbi:hypothetical protein MRB53_040425 [Persea americana]|nr:hypothetical protein MRB53_040425 [Persea americana]